MRLRKALNGRPDSSLSHHSQVTASGGAVSEQLLRPHPEGAAHGDDREPVVRQDDDAVSVAKADPSVAVEGAGLDHALEVCRVE